MVSKYLGPFVIVVRIAIVGTRGLPPNYGGYETFTDHFVKHMVERGHDVIVACEGRPRKEKLEHYNGAKLVYFPTKPPRIYSLRKIYEGINDLYFYLRLARKCDIMYILAGMGTQAIMATRLLNPKIKIVTSSDGLEWKRSKYSKLERFLIKSFVKSSLRNSDLIIHDNPELIEAFPDHDLGKTAVIEYGVSIPGKIPWETSTLEKIGRNIPDISPGKYWMVVARLQNDNNTHHIIRGFVDSNSELPLIVVGDVWDTGYSKKLKSICRLDSHDRIFMTGGIYDLQTLDMLRAHCTGIIHGHSAGGTNPSLLEAMSLGKYVIAHDNIFNRHVLNNVSDFFSDSEELSKIIDRSESDVELREKIGQENLRRVKEHYLWKQCFDKYDVEFSNIIGH